MDGKKKRNKKKKGNQGRNTGDATSNAEEAAPQSHNRDSAPKDHYSGTDADDAMSSVGEGILQYQNHVLPPQANKNAANADETVSSVGQVIPCYENLEPAMTHENQKFGNTVYADQRSIGLSDSSVELDKDRLYEAKLDKLHGTIKQLEDEKSLWLKKVNMMEIELEKLHNKVGCHAQNEEVLDNKVSCIVDANVVLTHRETSLKERLSGLEETNKALLEQVKVLDEASKNTVEENQSLLTSIYELESRLQAVEEKIFLSEVSVTKEVPENKVMDHQTDLTSSLLHNQTTDFTNLISNEGNELIANRGLNSSLTVTSENNHSHINNSSSTAYISNHPDETSSQFPEATSSSADQGFIHANEHQGFDKPRMNEEIVPVPLDDIQIHEDDPQPQGLDETAEVPFTDAPIVGAPFRLISFVARYVSGADLVDQK